MKSEPAQLGLAEGGDAFDSFLEGVDAPSALCHLDGTLLAASPAFHRLGAVRLLQAAAAAGVAEGAQRTVEVPILTGGKVAVRVARRGAVLAIQAALSALPAPSSGDERLLELSRQVALATSEEELLAVVVKGLKGLFPHASFCIRILDRRTQALTSLYAEGALGAEARGPLVLRKSAAAKTHLAVDRLVMGRVQLSEEELPLLFCDTVKGICAPLVASGELFGAINVEYREPVAQIAGDERRLIHLANQVAVGVRNAKLIDNLTFMRTYLEELLEQANALIVVTDKDRTINVFNRMMARLTGRTAEEVVGSDILSLVAEGDRLRVGRLVAAALRGEAVQAFETRLLTRDGREAPVSLAVSAAMGADRALEGVIAIGQDLSVVKELERRFIQAEKLATMGRLAASIVHEINNPLTAVSANAEALLNRIPVIPSAEQTAEGAKLRQIIESSERILRFTKDLVSYARPAREKPELVDLHKVLDLAVSYCDHVIKKHGCQVVRNYRTMPKVAVVQANLIQVFVNLITNACQAMAAGGTLTLSTREELRVAVVSISDEGSGIAPENLERIFEPFFTTKVDGEGTGLGLSIVQGIMESHGGSIEVRSQPARGTTFTLRLPLGD